MFSLRQVRSLIAVYEERSFTRAATRENATQSGISQHVSALEEQLGAQLFDRRHSGPEPTPAGDLFYARALEMLRAMEKGVAEVRASIGMVSGEVRAGVMPTFTRSALPPALDRFLSAYPHVRVEVIEGYSGALSDMVRAGTLDLALVPASAETAGLTVTPLCSNREMLVSGPGAGLGLEHLAPVRLADIGPVDMILPSTANVRRLRIETYLATHNVKIGRLLEMDAMLGTLELVARSRWMTVLPAILCVADADGAQRRVNPIADPELVSEFVVIEPARRSLSPAASLFLDAMRAEIGELSLFPGRQ
jgi:LysR family transcriptional regulator, nitrogen assimilation regulatory protein